MELGQSRAEHDAREHDFFIRFGNTRIPVSLLLILVSSAAFIPLILPLFDPGPPINSDIGVHYSAFVCYKNGTQWSLPTTWCSHGQAGLARFQRYGIVHAFLAYLFSLVFSMEVAFKLMIVVVFLVLPFSAFFLLKHVGFPLGGAIAYAVFLLEPGGPAWGGYYLHFVITGIVNTTATSLSLLVIFAYIWLLSNPSPLRVVLVSALQAVHFLSHQASSLWVPIGLIPILLLYRSEIRAHWRILWIFPLFFLLFISFWFVPALAKSSYFNPPGLGGIGHFSFSSFMSNFTVLQIVFVFLSLLSAGCLLFCKKREMRVIGAVVFLIPLVWVLSSLFPGFPYFRYFTIDRSVYEFRTFLLVSGSLFIGGLRPTVLKRSKTISLAFFLLLGLALSSFYISDIGSSRRIFTGSDVEWFTSPIYNFLERGQGRVIMENTYYHSLGPVGRSQIWSLSGAYSSREFLGNSDFWYTKDDYSLAYDGHLFYRNISNYTNDELLALLEDLNVQYLGAFEPSVKGLNRKFKTLFSPVKVFQYPRGKSTLFLYETPFNHSYFSFPAGRILEQTYDTLHGQVKVSSLRGGTLFFKVRHWPNWKASLDGKPLPVGKARLGLMEVDVPAGVHEIAFEYGLIRVDYAGYILTALGIVIAVVWILLARPT